MIRSTLARLAGAGALLCALTFVPQALAVQTEVTGVVNGATRTAVGSAGPVSVVSRFDPGVHGFHFVNAFDGPLPISIPGVGDFDLSVGTYGLCGGMVYAALDDFYAGGAAPPDTVKEAVSASLFAA